MSAPATLRPTSLLDLEQAMEAFTSISSELVASYRALEERAEHVEAELSVANAALAQKVAELDELRGRLEAILECLPTGVVVRDSRQRIVRANPAAAEILGSTPEALVRAGDHVGLRGVAARGEALELEREDGTKLVVASRYSPVVGRNGGAEGSVEILDDRTELTRLSARLHELDKMAALGTMAGGIAHEIRNPMNAIKGFAALLQRTAEPASKPARWARLICDGVDEVDAIITSLLSFAEPERLVPETVDAAGLVADAFSAVRLELEGSGSDSSRWDLCAAVDTDTVVADRIQLRQALRNLVANAVDAQPEGGRIDVRIWRELDHALLEVADAGPGIERAVAARAVEPFFTTRAEGTGLGLALVHRIAQLHAGRFEIADAPSSLGGACVRLSIPMTPAPPTR